MPQDAPSPLFTLHSPLGGLYGSSLVARAESPEPQIFTNIVRLGDLGGLVPQSDPQARNTRNIAVSGAGTGLAEQDALFLALAEGLERYCTCLWQDDQFISASADELGSSALDLATIPQCSKAELADPKCPLRFPNKSAPLRWVRGLSLLDGKLTYLPAIMVYLYTGYASQTERIWLPITTGCAGHVTYERAVLNGLLELVERDAIALVWLQKLTLPRLQLDCVPAPLSPYWHLYQASSKDLEYHLFNATTDLGISTIYGLQVAPANSKVTTLVSCSTDLDPANAVAKVIRDMAAIRIAFRTDRQIPQSWEEYHDPFDGATFMARAEQARAFDFLLRTPDLVPLSHMKGFGNADDRTNLAAVVNLLREKHMDAYVVDLTTDEAQRVGVKVVRVIVPALQPLSFHHRARYLGHPRLYEAPRLMGHPALSEAELNSYPQPFA